MGYESCLRKDLKRLGGISVRIWLNLEIRARSSCCFLMARAYFLAWASVSILGRRLGILNGLRSFGLVDRAGGSAVYALPEPSSKSIMVRSCGGSSLGFSG